MEVPASSITASNYMQAHESTEISWALHPQKVWQQFFDDVCYILKRTHLENFFNHINNLYQNIKLAVDEESKGELVFLDPLLNRNKEKIAIWVYRKRTHTDR